MFYICHLPTLAAEVSIIQLHRGVCVFNIIFLWEEKPLIKMSQSLDPSVKTNFSNYNAKILIVEAIQCDILFCHTEAEEQLIISFQ